MVPCSAFKLLRLSAFAAVAFFIAVSGCSNDNMNAPPTAPTGAGTAGGVITANGSKSPFGVKIALDTLQVNLVSDITSIPANRVDVNLLNAWGIALTPSGIFWISANHSSLSVIYDKNGNTLRPPVNIPTSGSTTGGAPSGAVFNGTTDFVIPGTGAPAKFIFAGEDGIISAWNGGSNAIIVSDQSSTGTVYKGLELGVADGHNRLYATDFHNRKVDVYDETFTLVSTKKFKDPWIPKDFGPFNIRNIDGRLFVTFAKHKPPDNMDDLAGPGNGFVDIFSPEGHLIRRFASKGALNSPWGLAEFEAGKGSRGEQILIGNFGDGRINVYDTDGHFKGAVKDENHQPLSIGGLWAITFLSDAETAVSGPQKLYFTAGPNDENDGIFGYLNLQRKHW
ncbi:MAG TPA: TIGR03118 family protein [Bacteroidota bacterium]|nr:TIGR03118 family protein [Bacteroidota bacterium]